MASRSIGGGISKTRIHARLRHEFTRNFMKYCLLLLMVLTSTVASGQTPPSNRPGQQPAIPQRPATSFDVSEYGVDFQSDPRLIVVMAALEAAGFEATPPGR